MPNVAQADVDAIVKRLHALIEGDGISIAQEIALREAYGLFHSCPEGGAYAILLAEIERCERGGRRP